MDDPAPGYDLRGRCSCGRLTVRVTSTRLRDPVAFTCPVCDWALIFIPPT